MAKLKKVFFGLTVLIIVVVLLGSIASTYVLNYYKEHKVIPPKITNASVIQVTTQNYSGYIKNSGFIQTTISSNLSILATGKVDHIYVKPGQKVNKGEVILSLDTKALQANLVAQQANLNSATLNYEGLKAVYKQGGTSLISVQQAKATVDQLNAAIKGIKQTLDNSKIIAPFTGVLGGINVSVGSVVQAGMPLASITPVNHADVKPYVDLGLTPNLLNNLSIGNKVDAYNEQGEFLASGTITALDTNISLSTGLSKIRIVFSNSHNLTDGKFVKLNIYTNVLDNQVVIPDIAVKYTIYGQTVYQLEPISDTQKSSLAPYLNALDSDDAQTDFLKQVYQVKEVFITSNYHSNNVALVQAGLKAGTVIVTNANNLQDGKLIYVVPGYGMGIPDTYTLPHFATVTPQNTKETNNFLDVINKVFNE